MGDALPSIYTILYGDIESCGIEDTFDHARDALDGEEEVLDLGGREVVQTGHNAARRDEDVAWEEWLEVYEGVGEGRGVENLTGSVCSICHLVTQL